MAAKKTKKVEDNKLPEYVRVLGKKIKVVAELANKFPSKQVEKFADDEINKMDEKQLRVYLEKKGLVIREEKVIEASVTSKDEGSDNGGKED